MIGCNKDRETIFNESKLEITDFYFKQVIESLKDKQGCEFKFSRGLTFSKTRLLIDENEIFDVKDFLIKNENCLFINEDFLKVLNQKLLKSEISSIKVNSKFIFFGIIFSSDTKTKRTTIIKTKDAGYFKKEFPNYKLAESIETIDDYKKIIIHIENDYYLKLSDEW